MRIKVTYKYDGNDFASDAYYISLSDALKNIHHHLANAEDVYNKSITKDGKLIGQFDNQYGCCTFTLEEVSEEEFSEEMNQY